MKFLVTGASGFLGQHICRYFEKQKLDYTPVFRRDTGDLTEFKDWKNLLRGIDVVVHAAAKAHDMSGSPELKNIYQRVNVDLTKTLAAEAKASGVKKFIFISTIKVNGEWTTDRPFHPDDPPAPADDYGISKLKAEQELFKLHEPGIFDVTVIRPCLIYGKGVKANFRSLIQLVKKRIPLPLGAVHNRRSFVSANNIADLVICCAQSPKASGQVFLVSDGADLSLTELLRTLARSMKVRQLLLPVPAGLLKLVFTLLGKGEFSVRLFSDLRVDISKNKELLGWSPPYRTDDEIDKMLSV